MGQRVMRNRMSFLKILINYRGENSDFTVQRFVNATITKWSEFTSNKTHRHHGPTEKGTHFCGVLAKNHNLILIRRKHQQPQMRDILQSNWPLLFLNVKVIKARERLRNKLEDTKEETTTKCYVRPWTRKQTFFSAEIGDIGL